jgi:DNA polymerase elongation subunit (family B)
MLPNFMHDQFGVPPNACSQQVDLESYAAKLFVPADKGDRSLGGVKKTYVERLVLDECDADEADVSIAGQHFEEVDETSITGFRAIRSDVADVTVDVQSQVLKAIVSQPRSEARQTAYEIAENAVEAIREGKRPLEELGRRHGLSKDVHEYGSASRTPHPAYRGAKYAHKFIDGERFAEGGKPMVYPVDRVRGELPATYSAETAEDGQRVDYVAVEDASSLPDEIVLDREQLIEDTVEAALADIFGTLGWRWSDVVDDGVQSTLGEIELS